MPRKPNKLIALLLSLLLGSLPLQNLFAFDSAPMAHEMQAMEMQAMDGQQMDEVVSVDCDDCDAQRCCEQSACTLHHCASCAVSAFLPCESLVLDRASGVTQSGLRKSLPANIHTDFFRPPRS